MTPRADGSSKRKTDPRVSKLLRELRALGSERNRAGMARYGINVDDAYGVSIYELRKLAKRLGTDHELSLGLWATGKHEARLLACFVDDPAKRHSKADGSMGLRLRLMGPVRPGHHQPVRSHRARLGRGAKLGRTGRGLGAPSWFQR